MAVIRPPKPPLRPERSFGVPDASDLTTPSRDRTRCGPADTALGRTCSSSLAALSRPRAADATLGRIPLLSRSAAHAGRRHGTRRARPPIACCGHGPQGHPHGGSLAAPRPPKMRTQPTGTTPSGAPLLRAACGHGPPPRSAKFLSRRGHDHGDALTRAPRPRSARFSTPLRFHRPNCIGLPPHLVRALSRQQSTSRTGLEESPVTFGDGSCDNSFVLTSQQGRALTKTIYRSAIMTTDMTLWAHLR